jgi:bifunctional non-homologous end joining protein LigD
LRGRDRPTASTPVTWDEVESCTHVSQLTFAADDVLVRVQEHGDLLAHLEDTRAPLPAR